MDSTIRIEALSGNLETVTDFVEQYLEKRKCPKRTVFQIKGSVEEIFVNICYYAYLPESGPVSISLEFDEASNIVSITFRDKGRQYDPLSRPDPDVKAAAMDESIGGLGIYITKKMMDEVSYEYRGGHNCLTIRKKI